jgi:hypothetical protein
VWLLTLCIKPFLPETHPWKHQSLTLDWWARGATDSALLFGAMFWMQSIFILWMLSVIY